MSVFVDTSAFLALIDADEARHLAVKSAWNDLLRADARL
jgi:predicted nucleic acid-binding protein